MIRLDPHVVISSDNDRPDPPPAGGKRRSSQAGPADFETRARAVLARRPDLTPPDDRPSIEDAPIDELIDELQRRQSKLVDLRKQRDLLLRRLGALDEEIHALGGEVDAHAARGGNALSLADALADAVAVGVVVSPAEAAEAVRKRGYRTTAKRFVASVTNTLSKDERFGRVGRGRYERLAVGDDDDSGD